MPLKKTMLLMMCLTLLAFSCAILHPKTDVEKAKALHWCNGAEWVIGVTDGMATIACASDDQTTWTRAGCMTYQLTSGMLRFQIQQVRLVASTVSSPGDLKTALAQAQSTFQKIEEVYQGEAIESINGAQTLFFDSTMTIGSGLISSLPEACGIKQHGRAVSA